MINRSILDYLKVPFISEEGRRKQYDVAGTVEHQAHSVIEPELIKQSEGTYYQAVDNVKALKKAGKGALPKKGFGGFLSKIGKYVGDAGLMVADNTTNILGMSDVITADTYATKMGKAVGGIQEKLAPIQGMVGQVAANVIAPGVGGQVLSGISAVGNGISAGVTADKNAAAMEEEKRRLFNNAPATATQNIPGRTTAFRFGGKVRPQYKAEGGEVIVHSSVAPTVDTNGSLNHIAPGVAVIGGDKHTAASGGVGMTGGDFIYSDKSKASSGKTYADEAKAIGMKKGFFADRLNSPNKAAANTARLMTERINAGLNDLAIEQEQAKTTNGNPKKMWAGGNTPKYDANGNLIVEDEQQQGYMGYLNNNTHSIPGSKYIDPAKEALKSTSGTFKRAPLSITPPINGANPGIVPTNNTFGLTGLSDTKAEFNPMTRTPTGLPMGVVVPEQNFLGRLKDKLPSASAIGEGITAAAPYIDNAVNAYVTSKTPNIPKPTMDKNVKLNTNVDINPFIANSQSAMNSVNNSIDQNVSNSAVGNTNKQASFAQYLGATNQAHATKNNQETDLRNKEVMVNAQINSGNNEKTDRHRMMQTQRDAGMLQDYADNAKNLASDIYTAGRDKKMDERDERVKKWQIEANRDSVQYLDDASFISYYDKKSTEDLKALAAVAPTAQKERLLNEVKRRETTKK